MDMITTESLVRLVNEQSAAVQALFRESEARAEKLTDRLEALETNNLDLEQRLAGSSRRAGRGLSQATSWGSEVVNSDQFQAFARAGAQGSIRVRFNAAVTSAPGSAGGMIPADHQTEVVMLPRQLLTVRRLLQPGTTISNMVTYARQTVRTLAAAPVAETEAKLESNLEWVEAEAPVRTIAHWIPVSRQAMDDAAQLQSLIDGELRYGVDLAEETQILSGDGLGQNLNGLIPQATAYAPAFSVDHETMLDVILLAIAQAQQSLIPATGVIINDLDWQRMRALKDQEGRYLGGGPFSGQGATLWGLPVVATPSMAEGEFLVGGFALAAQIVDRMETEVLISSEDRDNFVKNMLTVRAEKRVALAVKRPQALVYGAYEGSGS